MYKKIIEKIEEYDQIALYRHVNPDFDAFGSQFGMYDLLKTTYPDKEIYLCGDFSSELVSKYQVPFELKPVNYQKDTLAIILDSANQPRIDDQNYQLCKEIIKIDHHIVVDEYETIGLVDSSASSASQLVTDLFTNTDLKITPAGASALYMGIIGDTSRFLYESTDQRTFKAAEALLDTGIKITEIYDSMYLKKAADLNVNRFILNNYQVDDHVAYYILTNDNLTELNISRSKGSDYVNLLSGIEEYYIWMAITENQEDHNWRVSLRSRNYPVNIVAEKYRGGGHRLASGARLNSLDELDNLLNDLKELINEYNQ
ncbi:bifunctional oligoribonuclease/PAP phosphatase NrnA [uncultured Thomasclavelia sp.]|uniref:DHH family phosphoesterase n=1 Tax=uncultured Thomasclavelia sp. TaxID=3025759 RepID=UPI0025FA7766|nr:bifunctional oligoribonuclease/PAP phosphatase NrnA [uncultured Thomasclavelia sp.]